MGEKSFRYRELRVWGGPEWTRGSGEQRPHNTEDRGKKCPSLIPDVTSRWPRGGPSQPDDWVGDSRFPISQPSRLVLSLGERHQLPPPLPHQRAVIRSRWEMFRLNSGRCTLFGKLRETVLLAP